MYIGRPRHGDTSALLAFNRAKYWIIQLRQLIKRIFQRLVVGLRFHGKSALEPCVLCYLANISVISRPFDNANSFKRVGLENLKTCENVAKYKI